MRAYGAFMKKEFLELFRTYKWLVMGLVFLLLGIMSPLAAKFLPELMKEFMPEGMQIALTEPSALDAWAQFFKNVTQIGLIILVILFSGSMAFEYGKGTLVPILAKGMPRKTVILAKFTAASATWTGAYLLSFLTAWFYAWYFWRGGAWSAALPFSVFCLWLFGVLLVAASLFGGVLFGTIYGSLLFTGGIVVLQFLLNMVPKVGRYLPVSLASQNMALLQGTAVPADLAWAAVTAAVLTVLFLSASCSVFGKKQI
ncbi:ABC transporter permease [Qiania dongpingensis]|uniref:ABC transporter permease n=1 Tax=Qiania dongpingensis TaxID=2763669 RepID=A0A7G9G2H2_9FIRM|nr:ABC transporter permease [Qiania dongpingensis]QNM05004.1 ABC transporter permease [Qiania dongpingensis]